MVPVELDGSAVSDYITGGFFEGDAIRVMCVHPPSRETSPLPVVSKIQDPVPLCRVVGTPVYYANHAVRRPDAVLRYIRADNTGEVQGRFFVTFRRIDALLFGIHSHGMTSSFTGQTVSLPRKVFVNSRAFAEFDLCDGATYATARVSMPLYDILIRDGLKFLALVDVSAYRVVHNCNERRGYFEIDHAEVVGHLPGLLIPRILPTKQSSAKADKDFETRRRRPTKQSSAKADKNFEARRRRQNAVLPVPPPPVELRSEVAVPPAKMHKTVVTTQVASTPPKDATLRCQSSPEECADERAPSSDTRSPRSSSTTAVLIQSMRELPYQGKRQFYN